MISTPTNITKSRLHDMPTDPYLYRHKCILKQVRRTQGLHDNNAGSSRLTDLRPSPYKLHHIPSFPLFSCPCPPGPLLYTPPPDLSSFSASSLIVLLVLSCSPFSLLIAYPFLHIYVRYTHLLSPFSPTPRLQPLEIFKTPKFSCLSDPTRRR